MENTQEIEYAKSRGPGNMTFEEIQPFLDKLPSREAEVIVLYLQQGKNQKEIARMFSVTQGTISMRLRRAGERLNFLKELPKINDSEIESDLSSIFDNVEIEIIKSMKETTCQTKTAEIINQKYSFIGSDKMNQVKIRHRFEKCLGQLSALKDQKPEYLKYYNLLFCIKCNLYKLHQLPTRLKGVKHEDV